MVVGLVAAPVVPLRSLAGKTLVGLAYESKRISFSCMGVVGSSSCFDGMRCDLCGVAC